MKKIYLIVIMNLVAGIILSSCGSGENASMEGAQWEEVEITLQAESEYDNPYTDVLLRAEFVHENGERLIRPGFWDGGNVWKVRFASTEPEGAWNWKTYSSDTLDTGLHGRTGTIRCVPYRGDNPLIGHGLLRMSPGGRSAVHADGTPFLMIGDTPWALPWRGTIESVTAYAENRQERGFNAALLMSLQPDRGAEGPDDRTATGGFGVAFEDLREGHINHPRPEYFQYLDTLTGILSGHGIVPVYQPVFHGFGWKGLQVLGWTVDPSEYARYTRYLVARYGARPAMWLVGGDGNGKNNGIEEGGIQAEKWDAYRQPTGIHYNPFDDFCPPHMSENNCYHMNQSFQDAEWLDFQWCQTGHNGEHLTHKVERMYGNRPVKAVANGEPTYEGINEPSNGSGWWQGHEAWLQFLSGGTMGVVYGAGGLWNWKLFPDEPGWPGWANSAVSWREAIELPGAVYVGYLGKALKGLNTTDLEKHPELAGGNLCLARPGEIYIVYLPEGGQVTLSRLTDDLEYRWFDPVRGEFTGKGGITGEEQQFSTQAGTPAVLIVS